MMQEQTSNGRRGFRQRGQTGWFGSSGSSTRGSRVRDHKTSGVYAESKSQNGNQGTNPGELMLQAQFSLLLGFYLPAQVGARAYKEQEYNIYISTHDSDSSASIVESPMPHVRTSRSHKPFSLSTSSTPFRYPYVLFYHTSVLMPPWSSSLHQASSTHCQASTNIPHPINNSIVMAPRTYEPLSSST